jgi:ferric-dicitrate binding protein FerR (iron transport regulator)
MTTEKHSAFVDRYRASAEEVAASDLDQTILAAARRQAAIRRFTRRTRTAFFVTAFAVIAVSLLKSHPSSQTRATDYGKNEGATRSYLLNATTPAYSGAGSAEGAP